jgi:hypothetical protein
LHKLSFSNLHLPHLQLDELRALGLSVRSLRKAGYVLEALTLPHF